jgi:uncharacterized protein YjiS (DUF1127 family)
MFKRIYNFIKESQEKRIAYWQLNNMSDRTLKDIGVSRSEIWYKVYGT